MKEEKYKIKTIQQTCLACPSQWDIMTDDGKYIYARFRWGYLSVKLNAFTNEEELLLDWEDEDDLNGIMDTSRLQELTKEIFEWSEVEYL